MPKKETSKVILSEQSKIKMLFNFIFVGMVIGFCFYYLNVSVWEVLSSFPSLVTFFMDNFLPPNFNNISIHLSAVMDTVLFAIVGTYISAILSFLFGILMSEQMNPFSTLRFLTRFFISFLRNIPVLIWVSLMVFIFGVGNMVGLLGLILTSVGFLSRSYAETMDEIAGSKLEALHASGANYMQILIHGLIPEFIPAWINWTLFSFEINIRASAILGMVGAGGLGILIQTSLNLRNFREAFSLIIILVTMVLITEILVNFIRRLLKI